MKTIWKFPLELDAAQVVAMPWNARPIHAGLDPNGDPCVWAEVESANTDKQDHGFAVVGTGHPRPSDGEHLGSIQHGPFMWHVYHLNP